MKTLILALTFILTAIPGFAAQQGSMRLTDVCAMLDGKTLPAGCKATCAVENGIPGESSSKYTLTITKGSQSLQFYADENSMAQTISINDRMNVYATSRTQGVRFQMVVDRDGDFTSVVLNQIQCR